jgi:transcriptional regulator with XRE-family HTH domain
MPPIINDYFPAVNNYFSKGWENTAMPKPASRSDQKVGQLFAQRIKTAMVAKGIAPTSAALGRLVKRSTQVAHKWLSGKTEYPAAVDVIDLADALQVSIRWLVGRGDTISPRTPLGNDQKRAIDLCNAFKELGTDGKQWAHDWIEDGYRIYGRIAPKATPAHPYPKAVKS